MARLSLALARTIRRPALTAVAAAALAIPVLSAPASARGPEKIADVAEMVIEAVVNISTSQKVAATASPTPQLPPGSPFEEFFEEFFKNRRGQGENQAPNRTPRRVNSLGSGFVIDPAGLVVTNNHVIADADEITVVFTDSSRLKAEVVGRDQKTDLAVLRVKPPKPLKAVKFGNSDKIRLGEWVVAIGNPFSLGGSVTAGIVSARNRDINSGPYDNYIQTDAAINRGNSGGPLFNLDGEVIGVNTAIISPSGGSIGIGFAVPSNLAHAVVGQLREFGEARRGWLGVKIQQVTDEIAESLSIKPARGALVAGIDDKGPAKPAGIEAGDVIVKFDGKDIKEMRDLPRIVADTPVGKAVDVVVVRKGKEETKKVTLGRLDDGEKPKPAAITKPQPEEKSVVQKSLGLQLANMTDDLRKRYKIKDSIKGVVVTGVDAASVAADKRLVAGSVIVAIEQEQVSQATDVLRRVEQLKTAGKKTALLLVATSEGDMLFVALPIN
ncbi:MAG: Do family serine endopeptidase [Alphaproteobacteria bacterium]|nr:Do family serine endopeptidase [Alphaproteobacteria bacterium]